MTDACPWRDLDRARLVRLCAAMTGDRQAADDLAQETLLEAWRIRARLRDAQGIDRWLAAIARNVCRRWARQRGRDLATTAVGAALPTDPPDPLDLEAELERAEMAALVEAALARLPAAAREVMRARYLEDRSVVEIAAGLRTTPDAVSMRLVRGKAALRRLLSGELRDEAEALDLAVPAANDWVHTRVSCSQCGLGTLLMRVEPAPGSIAFRCARCDPNPAARAVDFPLASPAFARLLDGLVRPTAILRRADAWSHAYYGAGMKTGHVACTTCGARLPLLTYERDDLPAGMHRRGLYADCPDCGQQVSTSLSALTLALPQGRAFRRDHPRVRARPPREVEVRGGAAVVVGFEEVGGSARLEAFFAAGSLRLLEVHGPSLAAA